MSSSQRTASGDTVRRILLLGGTMNVETTGPIDQLPECPVCLGVHDPEIHDATITIHRWLRREIARRIDPEPFVILDNHVPLAVVAAACAPVAIPA